jgi:hypothetical protein
MIYTLLSIISMKIKKKGVGGEVKIKWHLALVAY